MAMATGQILTHRLSRCQEKLWLLEPILRRLLLRDSRN